jgi:hypothetical protein
VFWALDAPNPAFLDKHPASFEDCPMNTTVSNRLCQWGIPLASLRHSPFIRQPIAAVAVIVTPAY